MPQKSKVKEQFADAEYPIQLVGKQVEITDAMRNYAVEKLRNIKRFGGKVLDAIITMDVQKLVHTVEFLIIVNNTKIKVSGSSTTSMYNSIDEAIGHLQAKLRRYLARLHEHHGKHLSQIDMNVNVLQGPVPLIVDVNDQIEEENLRAIESELAPHKVVSQEKRLLKTLTIEEAIMKMELSGDMFMVYRSEDNRKLKIIYRRKDGNYGVMEPE
jgi:putative sigma-54 modulation protein